MHRTRDRDPDQGLIIVARDSSERTEVERLHLMPGGQERDELKHQSEGEHLNESAQKCGGYR